MTRAVLVILILLSVSSVSRVDSLLQENLGNFFGTYGANVRQVKIPDLLNQVCNRSQGNTTRRDACYGCFYRASVLPQGFPMLVNISGCADTYLNNTAYGHCQAYLRNTTRVPYGRSARLIYCSFLECIRQVNTNSLVRLNSEPTAIRRVIRYAILRFKKMPVVYIQIGIIDVRSGRLRRMARQIEQRSSFKFLKGPALRGVCIIKGANVSTTTTTTTTTTATTIATVRPSIDPRDPIQPPQG
ncbi:PREDICTED: uncharacterized protein LOC105450738 [Wasmannia auropunctata]|uniref:uncharacterized protein LOC105450738 n=1 Tax=Wasmannia auropunctata TaxID=64793 RepID=UPI0005EF3EB3|nr:PREDICTED: uncharacterized protein LOC105450738 [Wasmannia auropunctata]